MDTVCLWVGRVAVIGGLAYCLAMSAYAAWVGFAFLREWRDR